MQAKVSRHIFSLCQTPYITMNKRTEIAVMVHKESELYQSAFPRGSTNSEHFREQEGRFLTGRMLQNMQRALHKLCCQYFHSELLLLAVP